jgi:uncharacterized membrane protein (UPF0182 family)
MHDDDDERSGPVRPNFGGARPGGPVGGGGAGRTRRRSGGGPSLRLWIFGAIVVLVLLFGAGLLEFWTDVIWYRSVGFDSVFWTRIGAGAGLFLGVAAVALVVFLGNLWLARRLAPPMAGVPGTFRDLFERLAEAGLAGQGDRFNPREEQPRAVPVGPEAIPDLTPTASVVLAALSLFGAIVIGAAAATGWQTVLLWINRVPFDVAGATATVDPVFHRDVSWFLFDLPFLRAVQSIFNALVVGGLIVAFGRYLAGAPQRGLSFPTPVRVHLAVLAGLFLLSVAFGYQLDKYELVYSNRGIATGVSYTDANAQFFAYDLLTVLSGLAAAFLVGGAFTRWTWPLGATVAAWFLASLVVGRLYPEAVQRLTVDPNKFQQEQPFIANNIAMTRIAYNLSGWEERRYQGDQPLTEAQIEDEAATFANARLWDYRPLGDTLDQLQTVRTYYDFTDVDTDRYMINGDLRQVMLSARELNLAANSQATGWVNQRIVYTHGIGIAMVPVNEVTAEGQPVLFVKNLPPVSSNGAPPVSEPRIYFGEAPSGYVIVRAQQDEFDFPRGDEDGSGEQQVRTRWTGETGIRLDTTLSRLLFAFRFRDLDMLISTQVTVDSQLLMHRSLSERLGLIAPFLAYDKDPYVVVRDDGRLVYVQDAFTTSDRFPNAEYIDPVATIGASGVQTGPINYIRNSVKVVMDAYDGTMTFYVADPSDPIIRAWQGVFPNVFHPLTELPDDLRAHLRVPEDLFNIQTELFGRYHVTDPETFFTENDRWTVPKGQTNDQSLPSEAYYVIMRMPGEADPEFLLLQPMVPTSRPNMIAWVAARNDPEHYGGIRVYRFPTDTSVFGPAQIEARIDQDPIISAQVTLWDQSGSSVVRGNLIVVPIGDTIIYLQPIYLQSTSARFPEFQRIVVASPTTVVWGRTLGEALDLLLERGGAPRPTSSPGTTPSPGPTTTPGPTPGTDLPTDVAGLIAYANAHFEAAQAALRAGDFAAYGREIELVRQALAQLDELAGPTPTPAS